jgi:hypothetical protein
MSWLDACAYAELDRANGMRFPPTIAAWRVAGFAVSAIAGVEVSAMGTSGEFG